MADCVLLFKWGKKCFFSLAYNLQNYIQKYYPNNPVVAIDASVGTPKQMGCITLRKGALRPGRAVGKNICPIGHVEITGIFDNLHDTSAEIFCLFMGHIITQGIAQNFKA